MTDDPDRGRSGGEAAGSGPGPFTHDELAFLSSVFDLARDGATRELELAIRAGVPVNLTNAGGDSLLVLAAYHSHPATVRELLDLGADTERVNDRGQTALGAAVFRQSTEIVQALLSAGADPYGGGRSAVDVATFFELPAMLALLSDHPRDEEEELER